MKKLEDLVKESQVLSFFFSDSFFYIFSFKKKKRHLSQNLLNSKLWSSVMKTLKQNQKQKDLYLQPQRHQHQLQIQIQTQNHQLQ